MENLDKRQKKFHEGRTERNGLQQQQQQQQQVVVERNRGAVKHRLRLVSAFFSRIYFIHLVCYHLMAVCVRKKTEQQPQQQQQQPKTKKGIK